MRPGVLEEKRSYFAAKAAVVLLLVSGGVGYYAWYVRGERDRKDTALIAAATARDACLKQREDLQKQSVELGGAVARTAADIDREKAARESAEKGLNAASTTLQATQAELTELRQQKLETEKRLAAFRDLTSKLKKMIDTGKLEIGVRAGRMIVKLPAGVLFESGKAELSSEGNMTLMEVALVLREMPGRRFMVVGHTDNIPLKQSVYSDNWALSAARALNVTRFMVGAGMKPESLVAAGYGEYDPIKSNKTEAGRKANRRIEIVLLPSIEELGPLAVGEGEAESGTPPAAPPAAVPAPVPADAGVAK